jgi:hypothetical protein
MPLEHLAAPPAFEADDVIAMDGSPNRDGGCPLFVEFGCRFTETDERLMNGRDQRRELFGRDLVPPNICSNDVGREFSVERWRRRFVWHFGSPCRDRQNTMPGKIEMPK